MRYTIILLAFLLSGDTAISQSHIFMTKDVAQQIVDKFELYNDSLHVEFAFCLYGTALTDNRFVVDSLSIPPQVGYKNVVSWRHRACQRDDFIGWGHSHPRGSRTLSPLDRKTVARLYGLYGLRFTILVYEENGDVILRPFFIAEVPPP